jgi:hypothetical protein
MTCWKFLCAPTSPHATTVSPTYSASRDTSLRWPTNTPRTLSPFLVSANLVWVNRKAHVGRNPATGETIQIKAKRVVKFRVAKAAKDAILVVKK